MTDATTAAGPGDLGPFADLGGAPVDSPGRGPAGDGDDLDVAGSPGQEEVRAIQIPARFKEDVWRRAITVFQLYWDREGRVPSAQQAHAAWDRIPLKTYQALVDEPEFRRALELRGIELDPTDSLTDIQVMVLMKLTDPADKRTVRAKLRDLGVSWPRYQGWLKNPVFVREKRRRTEETFGDVQDLALTKLYGNVDSGDQRAIEFALEVTGRYNRQTIAIQDARLVVQTIVEAVITNVPDPKVREAILNHARAAVAGFDLNNRRAIES